MNPEKHPTRGAILTVTSANISVYVFLTFIRACIRPVLPFRSPYGILWLKAFL